MSGQSQQRHMSTPDGMSDLDKGLAVTSVITSILLGIALDLGYWWLGVPSGLATLLMVLVFTLRAN